MALNHTICTTFVNRSLWNALSVVSVLVVVVAIVVVVIIPPPYGDLVV